MIKKYKYPKMKAITIINLLWSLGIDFESDSLYNKDHIVIKYDKRLINKKIKELEI